MTIEPHDRTGYEQPPALPPPPDEQIRQQTQPRRGIFRRAGGAVVAAGLAVLKWGGVLLGLLGKTKLLGTMLSFFVSLAAYGYIFGWWFGLGFLILLLLHELGHVIQLRREGVPFSMPLFIPFMGAVVGMKGLPENAWTEAKVGLAGPILGGIASAGCLLLAVTTNSDLLQALAYTGFFINLFNLIPVLPLDGGRAAAALHPAFWFLGLFAVALLFFWHPNAILLFILILGGLELYSRWGSRHRPEARAYHAVTKGQRITIGIVYLALILALVAGMEISYLHRTF